MPGIYLYTGNRLEILADKLSELLLSSPLPPSRKRNHTDSEQRNGTLVSFRDGQPLKNLGEL